ncbi:P450-derived glycosyltransferase activator [Spirillospora sp. NPDC029432]|uniref:cytochrome P450 family protein n=1 Tax=Spirillospora sp. NPDC029432 TaxID=3154599 RepID=UPI0034538FFF
MVLTDNRLGRHLLTMRGVQWLAGAEDDPYALLLRASDDDRLSLLRRLREHGALHRSTLGAWVASDHALAARVLRDPRLSPCHPDGPQQHLDQDSWTAPVVCHVLPLDEAHLTMESAAYERLRGLAEPVLGEGRADRHVPAVADVVGSVVGSMDGPFDLMADLARPLAVASSARLLGVPPEERERFGRLCADTAIALDAGTVPQPFPLARALLTAIGELRALFAGLIADRRNGLSDELPEADADDLLAICMLVTLAGSEVAANLICNTMAALLDHPDQWAEVRADPDLAGAAVEETLRWDPPVRLESRIAHEDLELAGRPVAAGEEVVVLVEVANRDPAVYAAPDDFVIARAGEAGHLSLAGCYSGLVAPLARLRATTAVRAIAEGMPKITRRGVPVRRLRSPVVRSVVRFPVSSE